MRNAFAQEIFELAAQDERVVLLSGDIGNRMFDKFKNAYPGRFYNCGVAEANMISMAAGLAMNGMRPFVYTIASFLLYRPFEQIRIDLGYHQLPVVLVGVGGGFSYASNGPTHHAVEDIAALRSIPDINIISPCDAFEVKTALRALHKHNRPSYLRLGKKNEPLVYSESPEDFELAKTIPIILSENPKIAVFTHGNIVPNVKEAIELLQKEKLSIDLIHCPSIRPFDFKILSEVSCQASVIITIEEHSITGGLGSIIAEWLAESELKNKPRLVRLGSSESFFKRTTTQFDAREQSGLSVDQIVKEIHRLFRQDLQD